MKREKRVKTPLALWASGMSESRTVKFCPAGERPRAARGREGGSLPLTQAASIYFTNGASRCDFLYQTRVLLETCPH